MFAWYYMLRIRVRILINRGEAPTIVSFVTILVIVYLFANLLVDLLYAVLDPRIRYA